MGLTQQLTENVGLLEISWLLSQQFLESLWCSSRNAVRKETSFVYYNILTQFADQYRSHDNKSTKSCERLRIYDNARKHMTIKRKTVSTLKFDVLHRPPYRPDRATNYKHLTRYLQHFRACCLLYCCWNRILRRLKILPNSMCQLHNLTVIDYQGCP